MCNPSSPSPTSATALNERGDVVGYIALCGSAGPDRPFIWTAEHGLELIPLPQGSTWGWAAGINEKREIVGTISVPPGGWQGFFLGAGGLVLLPPAGTGGECRAFSINEHSGVAGARAIGDGPLPENAYTWSASTGFEDLGLLTGPGTRAEHIADDGTMLIWLGQSEFDSLGIVWSSQGLIEMGPVPGGFTSTPHSMNLHGTVAGWGQVPSRTFPTGGPVAFVWLNGEYVILDRLPGFILSAALDINAFDTVVGKTWITDSDPNASRAFIWRDGQLIDLNDLIDPVPGRKLTDAYGINDAGVIVTQGQESGSVSFLLTPRDRPASDVDGDCRVDRSDLEFVFRDWGTDQVGSDVNRDGVVDALDFLAVLSGWTQD
jgi:probable HAF family extracellular repeat protein